MSCHLEMDTLDRCPGNELKWIQMDFMQSFSVNKALEVLLDFYSSINIYQLILIY